MAWIKNHDTDKVVEVSESTAGDMILNGYATRADEPKKAPRKTEAKEVSK